MESAVMEGKTVSKEERGALASTPVGTHYLSLKAPSTYILPEEMAIASDYPADRIRNRLGVRKIRLPSYSQTNAALAADVVYEFVRWIASNPAEHEKLRREPIVSFRYATESNADNARPDFMPALNMARSKLLGEDEAKYRPILDGFKKAWPFLVTHACAGGGIAEADAVTNVRCNALEGYRVSEIVITNDTAVYLDNNAKPTEGCAVTFKWVTLNPALTVVGTRFGRSNHPEEGFTKYGETCPTVNPKTSMVKYEELCADALFDLLEQVGTFTPDFLISHVPFPDQAYDLHAQYRLHTMRAENPELLRAIEIRIGPEPLLPGIRTFSQLVKNVQGRFNSNGQTLSGESIIAHLENDPAISNHVKWVYKFRGQHEVIEHARRLHIPKALELPSEIGNSYTGSAIVAEASLLQRTDGPMRGIKIHFGSGGVAAALEVIFVATAEAKRTHLFTFLENDDRWALKSDAYAQLHASLVLEEKVRTAKNGTDLVEKDLQLLRGRLPAGFHVRSVSKSGMPDTVYVDADGKISDVPLRY